MAGKGRPRHPESSPATPGLQQLTDRQREVLRLLGRGLTDAQIASELYLSTRTVHAHLRAIYRKLNVSHRSAATRFAIQNGLV
jgi:DNA-binding NarL/FixJ family response regulator